MNIVIIGAGNVGQYLASSLSREQHNIILIDRDAKKLEQASWQMDVLHRHGSGTDWELLDDLMELSPDLLLALTDNDETNLVACSIAKNLGYPKTMARIRSNRYFNQTRLDFGRIFDADYLIGPDLLVANDILKFILQPGSVATEHFAHGAVLLRTIQIPPRWKKGTVPLSQLGLPSNVIVGLIRRFQEEHEGKRKSYRIIFPHGGDHILPGDEVTFIGETETVTELPHFFRAAVPEISSVAIIGGSIVAENLAQLLLPRGVAVRIVEPRYERCRELSELLPDCTIINHSGTDLDFLRSEKMGQTDLFAACTDSDEENMLIGVLGQQLESRNTVVVLSSHSYMSTASHLGIAYVVSPRVSASNRILSLASAGKVSSMVSLYDSQAKIVEIKVSMRSKATGIPLSELGPLLPADFLIAMIQNRGRMIIANGNCIVSPGDTIIVITHPRHLQQLETIF